jgi:hypothetical protein
MRYFTLLLTVALTCLIRVNAQQVVIPASQLPFEVQEVLSEYITILRTARNLDDCANRFLSVAGGGLVNPNGDALRGSVKLYSLKKDFENIKFYREPFTIERVIKTQADQLGYGQSAIGGDWYKIYIAKTDGSAPAPVHVLLPINHAFIKKPKIIQVGNL